MTRSAETQRAESAPATGENKVEVSVAPQDLIAAFYAGPVAAAVVGPEGEVLTVTRRFAQTVGCDEAACIGRRLNELLPPDAGGGFMVPPLGSVHTYRSRVAEMAARIDLAPVEPSKNPLVRRPALVSVVVTPILEDHDTIGTRALLALSRGVAAAQNEEEITAALSKALEILFPGRLYCVRLIDPKTLSLSTLYARGKLKAGQRDRMAIRRGAIKKTGLSMALLESSGVTVVDRDEPIFVDCERALAIPLAVGGAFFGLVNLEYVRGAPGIIEHDEPILLQLANNVAIGVRNLRSIEELTFLKTYLEELIENANALIMVANSEREILVFNRAFLRLTGYGRDEILGQDLLSFIPESERKAVHRVMALSLKGEAVTNFETRVMVRGGGEARIAMNTAAILGPTGQVEGIIAIGQDMTQFRVLEQKAEHAQRLAGFGRLAAGIVHELNNPLTSITVYAEHLEQKLRLAGHDRADVEKVRRILEAGQRIFRFAKDLLTYARPSSEKQEPLELGVLLDQAADMCEPVLRETGAKLVREYQAVAAVVGVKSSLLQVFVNLITNAAQSLSEGGTVTLALEPNPEGVSALVRDTGVGMSEEVRRRIFEPFFTTKPDGRGTGLGLSIAQGIVSRHGGTISVASLEGQGTTIAILLPRPLE